MADRNKPPGATPPCLLIVDDQPDVLIALRLLIKGEGWCAEGVPSPALALVAVEKRAFDAVLMDLNYAPETTSGQEGLELVSRLRALHPTLPVIVMTAWANGEMGGEALRRGARDFIEKPWDNARLMAILRAQVELGRAARSDPRLEQLGG